MNISNTMKGLLIVLALCTALPAISATDTPKPFNVGKQFNCKACHVNRLSEIKKNVQPTLVPPESVTQEVYDPQDSASTRRMCLSCHDSFVMDSRFVWNGNHATHPVGVALSETKSYSGSVRNSVSIL
jgi:hypothetical protein